VQRTLPAFARIPVVVGIAAAVAMAWLSPKTDSRIVGDPETVVLFAHRGPPVAYPENSMGAIQDAMAAGYRAVEIDIQESADRQFFLLHDETCTRMLGISGRASGMRLSDLQTPFLLHEGRPTSCHILTLDSLGRTFRGTGLLFYVDLKLNGRINVFRLGRDLVRRLESCGLVHQSIVANSNLVLLAWIELLSPEVSTVLEGFNPGHEWFFRWIPRRLRPDYVSGFASNVSTDHAQKLRNGGILGRKIIYGAAAGDLARLCAMGFTKIIVDDGPDARLLLPARRSVTP